MMHHPSLFTRSLPWSCRTVLARRGVCAILATLVIIGLLGCAGRKPPPEIAPGRFSGPAVALAQEIESRQRTTRPTQLLRVDLPSPGWHARLDQVRDALQEKHVFLTLRRPNPTYIYAQVVTPVFIGTGTRSGAPIAVYARELPASPSDDENLAYTLALRSAPPIKEPAP